MDASMTPSKVCNVILSQLECWRTDCWNLIRRATEFLRSSFVDKITDCSAVVHVASVTKVEVDPHQIITPSIAFIDNLLAAAGKELSIQRFVLTSSSAAVSQDICNEVYDVTHEMWADWAVKEAWAPPPYTMERARANYYASKVITEQNLWRYVKERKPHFAVNSVLPDFIIGLGIHPEKQGYVSSMSLFKQMVDNSGDTWRSFGPQWCVDAVDTALLHIAGLSCPYTKNQRIFAYGHRKTWKDFIERLEKMYPHHKFPGKLPTLFSILQIDGKLTWTLEPNLNEGKELSNVVERKKAEELLKWMGKSGWRPLDEVLREVSDPIV